MKVITTELTSWKLIPIFTFILLFTAFNGNSQMNLSDPDTGIAMLDIEGCITLIDDNNGAVHNLYELERIEAHFVDMLVLKKRLGHISNNRVYFALSADETHIMMYLHKDRVPAENSNSIAWWNSYISISCIQL